VRYAVRPPSRPLAPFVSALWYFEGHDLLHTRERVLPTGALQLLVNLEEDELRWWEGDRACSSSGAVLGGARDAPVVIDTRNQRRIAGVAFHPGGAAAFVRDRVDALSHAHVPIEALWAEGGTLRERLLDARDGEAVLDVMERALLAELRATPSRTVAFAVRALEDGRRVSDVARELGVSGKLLHRRFAEAVGLAPKRFARVRRMQRVLRVVTSGRRVRWAELAAAHAFYDQAHLIREFRELTGTTPAAYVPRNPDEPNHIVLE